MYKIDKKYGNLNRKIYIDSNFEHLLASNFTESLFLKCSNAYKIFKKSLSCSRYASTAPVPNASTDNQYGTSTGRPVQNIVIIPNICQHCACICQYGRSTAPVVNFLLGGVPCGIRSQPLRDLDQVVRIGHRCDVLSPSFLQ